MIKPALAAKAATPQSRSPGTAITLTRRRTRSARHRREITMTDCRALPRTLSVIGSGFFTWFYPRAAFNGVQTMPTERESKAATNKLATLPEVGSSRSFPATTSLQDGAWRSRRWLISRTSQRRKVWKPILLPNLRCVGLSGRGTA
jgi:hypothetical protein